MDTYGLTRRLAVCMQEALCEKLQETLSLEPLIKSVTDHVTHLGDETITLTLLQEKIKADATESHSLQVSNSLTSHPALWRV